MIKKILFLFLSFEFCVLSFAHAGNNLSVTCDSAGCRQAGSLPLFSETNTYPGYTRTQYVNVLNQRDGDCDLVFSTLRKDSLITSFSSRIFVDVAGNSVVQNDTLSQLYVVSNRSLGKIAIGSTAVYSWTAEVDPTLGNEFQGAATKFDLDFGFSCLVPTTPDGGGGGASTGGGGNGTPVCNATTPNATTIYAITDYNNGTALIRWNKVAGSFTHYLISFGPDRNTFLYGAPNIGSDNQYTVRGLTPNARYCFYVRAINDCAPGPASNVWCINPGAAPGTAVPEGFQPGVLGEQTSVTPTTTPTPEVVDLGTVEGVTTNCARYWLPLLFIFVFIINLIKFNYLLSFVLCALTFLIDWYMLRSRCCLVNPIFCQYFWVGNILSYLLPLLFKNKEK